MTESWRSSSRYGDELGTLRPLAPLLLSYVWLPLFPFVTGWMGENHFAAVPAALYGGILLAAAVAYRILQRTIIAAQGSGSTLKAFIGSDWKGKLSIALYATGIVSAFAWPWVALTLYVAVTLMWLVPDRRIERSLHADGA